MMPAQKPGRSKQDYGTPRALIDAVEKRFGPLAWDLAATDENAKAAKFITPDQDSLSRCWSMLSGNMWLNPPFANIEPWAKKCAETILDDSSRILLLTPASVGSEWFRGYVNGRALVLALSPRLTFEGCADPYPKDCIISVYGKPPGFQCWRWRW